MDNDLVIVPSRGETYVELAHTKKQGRLFRKHILNKGTLIYPKAPGGKVEIDDKFVDTLINNFKAGVSMVQVPLADKDNKHTEDPNSNIGEVVDLKDENGKVYAIIDARDNSAADKLGKTLLGASAMMSLNYFDTSTGKHVGPTLLHSCVTNRPYVTGLEDYEEIVAATADSEGKAVMLTEEDPTPDVQEKKMTKEELLAELKTAHGIDVEALSAKAGEGDAAKETVAQLSAALEGAGVVKLANGEELTPADVAGAVAELAKGHIELSSQIQVLTTDKAAAEVDALVKEGKILPASREAMLELRLSNADLFAKVVPAEAIIKLTTEVGAPADDNDGALLTLSGTTVDDEVARLAAAYNVGSGK